ncbi:hypothetical protein Q8A73_011283 [Channa argus]|nr:hypothetical protein Q8A73_011283 [Channa argus]
MSVEDVRTESFPAVSGGTAAGKVCFSEDKTRKNSSVLSDLDIHPPSHFDCFCGELTDSVLNSNYVKAGSFQQFLSDRIYVLRLQKSDTQAQDGAHHVVLSAASLLSHCSVPHLSARLNFLGSQSTAVIGPCVIMEGGGQGLWLWSSSAAGFLCKVTETGSWT